MFGADGDILLEMVYCSVRYDREICGGGRFKQFCGNPLSCSECLSVVVLRCGAGQGRLAKQDFVCCF